MRLTITLFIFIFVSIFSLASLAQNSYAHKASNQSNGWLEENENANKAIRFSADVLSDAVELFWEVSREDAVAGYELQRSTDGSNFEKIAWISSIGEEEVGGTYLHLDETAYIKEVLRYRVKAVRKDGQYLYSPTQIIDLQLSRSTITLSPSNDVQPRFITLDEEDLDVSEQIELLDASGEILMRISPTSKNLSMDLSKLKQGVYFIKMVLSDGEDKVERIVKQG